jgi:hypothetical protein
MKRHFPDIRTDRIEGYASILAHNFDTVQESYCLKVGGVLEEKLQKAKEQAQERFDGDEGLTISFGGESFQIGAKGTRGKSWVLKNDDFMIMIGRGAKDWKISVKYLSAGLWEYGLYPLKKRILKCLLLEMQPYGKGVVNDKPEIWQRISKIDYAFDFYSPKFTQEMMHGNVRQNMVLPSKVKGGLYFTSDYDETIWFGKGSQTLQICVYDKGLEIQHSSKAWMYKIYEREGYYPSEDDNGKHIWRVELRLQKEFIKNRQCLTLEHVTENLKDFLCEALAKRRLAVKGSDTNKARWDLHPLWAECLYQIGGAGRYRPMGRLTTLSAEEKAEIIKKGIAGSLRSLQVLETGSYDYVDSVILAQNCASDALEDENHDIKVKKAQEKYLYESEAK